METSTGALQQRATTLSGRAPRTGLTLDDEEMRDLLKTL
jgi:hypothetical protein